MKRIILPILFALMFLVTISPASATLAVTQIDYEPAPAEPGDYIDLIFKVQNIGDTSLPLKMKLVTDYPFYLNPGDDGIIQLGKLSVGKEAILEFRVRVDPEAIEGDYENDLRLKECFGENCSSGVEHNIPISIRTPRPTLDIVEVITEPNHIRPGHEFDLTFKVTNPSDSGIRDVTFDLNLSSSDIPIAPLNSLSEKTIDYIGPRAIQQLTFNLITEGDAGSKLYKVPLDITFYDNLDNEFTKSDIATILLFDQPELIVNVEDTIPINKEKTELTLLVINKAPIDARFVSVEVLPKEEYEVISAMDVYIGDVDSDDIESADFDIIFNTRKDSVDMPVKLTYSDVSNNKYSEIHDVNVKIYSAQEASALSGERTSTFSIVFLLILIFGGLWAYKKYFKKKKQ